MPVEKLRAVDQRPGQVHRPPARFAGPTCGYARDVSDLRRRSGSARGSSGKARSTHLAGGLLPGCIRACNLRACSILRWMWLEFSRCSRCAGRGAVVPLRFQPGVARRAAEHLEERAGDAAVGQRDRALVLGNERERLGNGAGILLGRPGDLVQGVDQHLRLQPAQRVVREIGRRLGLAALGESRKAGRSSSSESAGRGASGRSRPRPAPAPGRPAARDCCGGLSGPDVVRLVDDAAAQQPGPDAVDDVAREPGILRRRSANRRRPRAGRWSGDSRAGVPSGKTAVRGRRRYRRCRRAALPGSKKTISSFHSPVDL